MSTALSPLVRAVEALPAGRRLAELARDGQSCSIGGVRTAARPLVAGLLARHLKLPALWVTPTLELAERLYEDAALFMDMLDPEDAEALGLGVGPGLGTGGGHNTGPLPHIMSPTRPQPVVGIFPERETSIFDEGASDPERLRVLQALSEKAPLLVIAPVLAVLQKTVSPQVVVREALHLRRGGDLLLETFTAGMVERGYERVPMVELRGQFSIRGGIVDVYPSTGEPVRIELFGDQIDTIRQFDLDSQRSTTPLDEVKVLPLREHEAAVYLTEYLPKDAFVILDEPARLKLRTDEWSADQGAGPQTGLAWTAVEDMLGGRPRMELTTWGAEDEKADAFLPTDAVPQFAAKLDEFTREAVERSQRGETVVVVTNQSARMGEIFTQEQNVACRTTLERRPEGGEIYVIPGHLSEGFQLDALAVFTDRELLGLSRRRRYFRTAERGSLLRLEDLRPGDVVVHVQHGIGRFDGLATLDIEGSSKDFLKLSYAKGDSLYVPVEQMDMVSKYSGADATPPSLSRLGRAEWQAAKRKVSEEVQQMAEQLLRLTALRQAEGGHAYPPDQPWQEELEAAFPFEETRDQQAAIDAVKDDMEQPRPMDRLVCGDVGYGKTEVAIRAAFKAVLDGKQVAVLVPTTVLAQQHFTTFRERMAPFPVRIDVLSRFRSYAEARDVLEAMAEGKVDIVVGTHRLLQKDGIFKNLGLIIVDEEQHFGVAHKERLKELKATVDVMTMTATPIPRTLQMALMGLRDLSLIVTPPQHRLPIKTYLFEASPEVIQGAITRELNRDGQVFFVHNRVRGIEKVAQDIRKLVPGARVVVGHGQMSEDRLEKVMMEFIEGEHDVLVCTTIIESGLDMPTVNTIIVHNAHMFGLGQLYQLRGRVGRAHHQAYCYLLYPPDRSLTPEAEQRLDTIREFTALGSGYQIALRDLEIRGAGNLLGADQSGFIASVGFELYCQMLEDAVAGLKGDKTRRVVDQAPAIDLPVEAFLPDSYVSDSRQKITLYKRLAEMRDETQVDAVRDELRDRFGPIPVEAERLLDMVRLKALCIELAVPGVKFRKTVVERSIAIVVPLLQRLTPRQLRRLEEIAEASVSFGNHTLTLRELPLQLEPEQTVLRVLRWLREHGGA